MLALRPLSGVFSGVLLGVLFSLCLDTDVGVFNGVVLNILFLLGVFHPNPNISEPLFKVSSSSLLAPSETSK